MKKQAKALNSTLSAIEAAIIMQNGDYAKNSLRNSIQDAKNSMRAGTDYSINRMTKARKKYYARITRLSYMALNGKRIS